jgi:hypothetical protein
MTHHVRNVAELEWTPEFNPENPMLARHCRLGEFELDGSGDMPDVASQARSSSIITIWHHLPNGKREIVANIMVRDDQWETRVFQGLRVDEEIELFDSLADCINASLDLHLEAVH